MSIKYIFNNENSKIYDIETHAEGPKGELPLTPEMLIDSPSGNIFALTLNTGMGWDPNKLLGTEVLILGTQGGIRAHDGSPIALGYHTGHWEIGLQMTAAAEEITKAKGIPYAAYISDPCDGRSQGTIGMFDSLPYRNDAAIVFRRLIRSLPTRKAVIGVATCDKGLPAMMIALAAMHDLPTIIVPGGATLPPTNGEDAGKVQTIGARFANGELTLQEAAELGCRACASPGGGCQFLGTAGTSQVVAEGLGLALPHSALAPSGQPIWLEVAKQSARAVLVLKQKGITTKDIITDKAIENAMTIHAAFGGSTNLLLHIPAIAHAAKCKIPTVEDWTAINKRVPRLVSVLPNGPVYHPTVRAFLAGGVPEVMLHLRKLGLLHEDVMTVTGETLGKNLDWWEASERRERLKQRLLELDGVNPDEVIMSPEQAKSRGLTSTITFPTGNIAPEGAVIKSTAIDAAVVGEDGIYSHTGKAKVFTSEKAAIAAIKHGEIHSGDIMVVIGGGPSGTGMEETYQLTSSLKHLSYGKYVSLLTDARFSGVSTGACVGHIGPEALVGGPIGKLRDGDIIEMIIDRNNLVGSINFIGTEDNPLSFTDAAAVLEKRSLHPDLKPHADLPDDTRLWAALQSVSGGTWTGSIYDVDKIIEVISVGQQTLADKAKKEIN
ncbi:YjhG/YagF family D-xylonate dehydratase [Yersinia alsatica]|uniref:YjhG/YagF family D-xylonate dehydratase n=1 Tax=Yersinia alsatica TaxID=2890317 RepID=A0ABY5UP58_9GAMM|nr:YjhG/YagF family D-xylonate dehydratase [Yersinia alsatica]OWF70646.1 YjhG/YagF family D-xylonate dehydratase [Yersinia frederiksenii]UWM43907.1 YjhG/YagF family D-xylonate dehydratase [Yersinia alsatica]CNK79389.1 dihydroxy-acid dehydratase [Yersinia frederiksenii]CNK80510.1 dihydroxy-acid dehydratase [Yersinia frederiksenii]